MTQSDDYILIGNKEVPVKNCELEQSKLKFYPDNPRVYSVLKQYDENPSQEEIEKLMRSKDHVKTLKESIKSNGGLIDPILVRDGDYVVLEGNSRLAAYRILATTDPIKWGRIKAVVLPADISDSLIFRLIGQYHIVGRKDWEPYEQAGYLYRTKRDPELLAKELGIKKNEIVRMINVYEYMLQAGDNHPNKWSFYEELLKNRAIKKAFKDDPVLEEKIIDDIKGDKIRMAIDVRKLGDIAKVGDKFSKKVLKDIASGEESLYEAYDIMSSSGRMDNEYQTVKKFRMKITDTGFAKKIMKDEHRGDIVFELKKIYKAVDMTLKKIENSK